LLRWRRDVRDFDRRVVAEEDMGNLLRCAALAPSVGNAQPWRFVRVRSSSIRDALAAHVDTQSARAAERYAGQARYDHYVSLKLHGLREAPELLAVFCDEQPDAGHGLGIATMPEMLRYSCVLAIHNLWLTARLRGIGLGWVSILDPQTVHTLLDVPPTWSLIALLCIGYPTEEVDTPQLEQRGWQSRQPWSDRVFER
jgi:5,6-dimethylbenzimidazole synthase